MKVIQCESHRPAEQHVENNVSRGLFASQKFEVELKVKQKSVFVLVNKVAHSKRTT